MRIKMAASAAMVAVTATGVATGPASARVDHVPPLKVVKAGPTLPCQTEEPIYVAKIPKAKNVHHPRIRYRLKVNGLTVKSKQVRGERRLQLGLRECPESMAGFHRISVQARWTGRGLPWSPWKSTAIRRR